MKLVVDTNIILSALIKDSITREIIVDSGWKFYYPESSFHEIQKYKDLVLEKSGITENSYTKLLEYLLSYVTVMPHQQIKNKLEEANKLLGKFDPDDVVFLATALSLEKLAIWSDDKDFDKQDKCEVLKTREIISKFIGEL